MCVSGRIQISRNLVSIHPVRGEKVSERLGGDLGCKDKNFPMSFSPDGSRIGSIVYYRGETHVILSCTLR